MAADIFLKMTGFDGESTDKDHAGQIEVISFSSGVSMPVSPRSTAGSATKERASLSDLTIKKLVDSSTPALFKAACQGQHIDEVILSVNRAAGDGSKVEYIKYTLNDVVLSNYHAQGNEGGGLPVESLALNYAKFKVDYVATDPKTGASKGAKTAGWDVGANAPV